MKIIKLIDKLREKYKSESAMSRDLGISRQAIKYIEDGTNHPSDETILLICKKLGVKPEPVIIENAIDRSKGETKKVWENIEKKLANIAASILVVPALLSFFDGVQCILCKIVSFESSAKLQSRIIRN